MDQPQANPGDRPAVQDADQPGAQPGYPAAGQPYEQHASGGDDPGYGHCLRCGELVQLVGIESFRVGGTSGGWNLLFGRLAELGEGMIDLEVFACPRCRKVELRVPVN